MSEVSDVRNELTQQINDASLAGFNFNDGSRIANQAEARLYIATAAAIPPAINLIKEADKLLGEYRSNVAAGCTSLNETVAATEQTLRGSTNVHAAMGPAQYRLAADLAESLVAQADNVSQVLGQMTLHLTAVIEKIDELKVLVGGSDGVGGIVSETTRARTAVVQGNDELETYLTVL